MGALSRHAPLPLLFRGFQAITGRDKPVCTGEFQHSWSTKSTLSLHEIMLRSQRTNATALDTAIHMLDAQPTVGERLIRRLLLQRQLLAAWLLGRHEDLHLGERKREEAQILQEPASSGQGIGCGIGNRLIMDAAAVGVAQKEDREGGIDQQDIFSPCGPFSCRYNTPSVQPGLGSGRYAVRSRHGQKGGRRCGQGRWCLRQRCDHGLHVGLRDA